MWRPSEASLRAFGRRAATAFLVDGLIMILIVVLVNFVINHEIGLIQRVTVHTAALPPQGANYLVIGSDSRAFVHNQGEAQAFGNAKDESGQRSDTMMVVHVEPGARKTLVVSFPRDLWVNVPGIGMAKINAAFNAGPDRVLQTLKANFGVDINHYIEVNFKSFQGVVRAIGSVPTYFPYAARDKKTGLCVGVKPTLNQKPCDSNQVTVSQYLGCTRLNGPDALAYVRSRALEYYSTKQDKWISVDSIPDIGRIKRQQTFIRGMAALAIAKSLDSPTTALSITDRVVRNLKADRGLEKSELLDLVDRFRSINPNDQSALEMQTFPWKGGPDQNGQSVLYPDDPAWRGLIARLQDFSGDTEAPSTVQPANVKLRVLNATGVTGNARAAEKEFVKLGFQKGGTGNDPRGTIDLTEVRYAPGQGEAGRLVLSYVDPQARFVADSSIKGADVEVVLGNDFRAVVRPATPTTVTTTAGPTLLAPGFVPGETNGATPVDSNEFGPPAPKKPPC